MKPLLTLLFLACNMAVLSQNTVSDTTIIKGRLNNVAYIFDKPDFIDGKGGPLVKSGEFVFIIRLIKSVNPKPYPSWYYCIYKGIEGFLPTTLVDIYGNYSTEKWGSLNANDTANFQNRLTISRRLSINEKQKSDSAVKVYDTNNDQKNKQLDTAQKGLIESLYKLVKLDKLFMISYSYPVSSPLNYPGFDVRFINGSGKRIKYTWFGITAYNAVDDIIGIKEVQCIGPVEPFHDATYKFDNVFFTKVSDHFLINSVKIQYMDKSVIALSGPKLELESIKITLYKYPDIEHLLTDLYLKGFNANTK